MYSVPWNWRTVSGELHSPAILWEAKENTGLKVYRRAGEPNCSLGRREKRRTLFLTQEIIHKLCSFHELPSTCFTNFVIFLRASRRVMEFYLKNPASFSFQTHKYHLTMQLTKITNS
jgi:hypothetical protein